MLQDLAQAARLSLAAGKRSV